MQGHPLSRQPFQFHQHTHTKSSQNLKITKQNATLKSSYQQNKQKMQRSKSSHKMIGLHQFSNIFESWDQNREPSVTETKQSMKTCSTRKNIEELGLNNKQEGKLCKKLNDGTRLGDRAGNALSIDLITIKQTRSGQNQQNSDIATKKQRKDQILINSGYGVVHNPYPQYLQPHEKVDFSNLYKIGRFWSKFQGSFQKGSKSGPGNIYLTNGILFSGYFENDVANGKGAVYIDGQLKIKGVWSKNKLVTKF